jgi:hypothetical protein
MANKKLDYAGMQKRIAETTGTPPSGNPIYRREPQTQSQQDSMAAYVKYRIPELKPVGQPKKYIGMQPSKPKKK